MIQKNSQKNTKKKKSQHPHLEQFEGELKKGIGLFYKVSFSIFLTFFIVLFYFIVLVSTKPKSFSYVTQEIRYFLAVNLGDATIKESHISFTKYGTLKLSVDDFRVFYLPSNNSEKQDLMIPKIESEFSLLDLIFFQFKPSKVKILNPEIVINQTNEVAEDVIGENQQEDQSNLLKTLFLAIRVEKIPVKNFEIENATLVVNGKHVKTKVLLKSSQIRTSYNGNALNISSNNVVNFYNNTPDVGLKANCNLEKNDSLRCNLVINNFFLSSIFDLYPAFHNLQKVNASLNANASILLEKGDFKTLSFRAEAAKGDFDFPEFFHKKMTFDNLIVVGEFHKDLGVFNLSEIKTNFHVNNPKYQNKAQFSMIFAISDIFDAQNRQFNLNIGLKNVPNNEVENFWPKNLSEAGARDWVTNHIKEGNIDNAYADFTLKSSGEKTELTKIDAGLSFSGSNLNYSDSFPKITDISGSAKFSKKDMKIEILSGNVLGSKISQAQVSIDDFSANKIMLNISGKSKGSASDSLKHADNSQKFANQVEQYLNGNSFNNFDIRIPLIDNLTLKDTYIAVNSTINDLKNDYIKGGLIVTTKKDYGKNDFITKLVLDAAEYSYKTLDISKKRGVESNLDLVISFADPKKIAFNNVNFWKKDVLENGGKGYRFSKISGNAVFDLKGFSPRLVNLKNENFGWNNYSFSYLNNYQEKKISLKGKVFNLEPLITNKFFSSPSDKSDKLDIDIVLGTLLLSDNKLVKSFYLSLDCYKGFCSKGVVRGNYDQKEYLNLQIDKKPNKNSSDINGRITDIGYLAEALSISDKVLGGDAKVNLTNKFVNGNSFFGGEITIENDITIFETATVKKLAKDNLFSKIKDKIFSSEKITFNSVKVNFELSKNGLNINSLLANNYKIGITAKGLINFKDDSYNIKGMIIPGFIINNLFGIGNIPILGNVVSGILTGGEGGGLFGIRYQYSKNKNDKEAKFDTNKVSAFVPTTIRNLFDAI